MTPHRPPGWTSPGETFDRIADPGHQGHHLDDCDGAQDHSEQPDNRVPADTERGEASSQPSAEHEAPLSPHRRDPDRPEGGDKERVLQEQSLIVVHGARSLLMTSLVVIMALAAIVLTPHVHAHLPWSFIVYAYAVPGALLFLRCRSAAAGGIVPLGSHGDSRFVVGVIGAAALAATPAATPYAAIVPFALLLVAAVLCGMADGAWIAAAMRHLKLSFFQALRVYLRPARAGAGTTWRSVTGDRP